MPSPEPARHTLPNGLTALLDPMPDAHSAAAGVFFDVGSRDEADEVNGVSHFLEHMAFKGDGQLSWQDINERFDDLGAAANAYTSRERTAYHAQVLPEHLHDMLGLLGTLTRPALADEDFETERQVILEEIAMCDDDPTHRVYDAAMTAHFGDTPGLGRTILGPAERIEAMTPGQMRAHHARHYRGPNAVVAVAGRFDESSVLDRLAGVFAHLPAGEAGAARAAGHRPAERRTTITDGSLNRAYLMAMAGGPSKQDAGRHAAMLLADVLGDEEGSRLYWALVDPAEAEEAALGWQGHVGTGAFWLSMTCEPGQAEAALAKAREVIAAAAGSITGEELARSKAKLATSLAVGTEHPMARARRLAGAWLDRRELADVGADLAAVEAVTPEHLTPLLAGFGAASVVELRP